MIGIVFVSDIMYCPYLKSYTDVLTKNNKDFDVLFWNRESLDTSYPSNYLSYDLSSIKKRKPITKIFDFFKYRRWLTKKIKEKKYEKLIILSTLSGMIIPDVLLRQYKNKYIFDIRDYSYEENKLFYFLEKKIIENSFETCLSSEGFKFFLPNNIEYQLIHNFDVGELQNKRQLKEKKKETPLNLVFIGGVRYFEHQKKIIDHLKNDVRFNLVYHGAGIELDRYIEYCEKNDIKNVMFTGAYDNKNKSTLLESADILNNSYMTDKFAEVEHAISNKYYDGLIYGIPQLVEVGTFKEKKVTGINIGIGIDVENRAFADDLFNYYYSIDKRRFNESCSKELNTVVKENKEFIDMLTGFIIE